MKNPGRGERAAELFASGYNCGQAVFLAFCGNLGIDEKTGARLANCLGGGFAQTGGVCGAVSGACLALSAKYGREEPVREGEQLARQQKTYSLVQRLQADFAGEFGAIDCPALLEKGLADSGGANDKANCPLYVRRAAELAQRLDAEQE